MVGSFGVILTVILRRTKTNPHDVEDGIDNLISVDRDSLTYLDGRKNRSKTSITQNHPVVKPKMNYPDIVLIVSHTVF